MSLQDLLAALHERRMADPPRRAAHRDVVERLLQAEVAAGALKAGDAAPGFLLPDAEGRLVASEELTAAGPAVLTFFRGGWCPYCDVTMHEMERAMPALAAAGAQFVAIWPETGGLALRIKRERRLSYPLLVDVDNAVAMQFGIVYRVPQLYRDGLLRAGVDLVQRHGNAGWMLPIPATFIITPDRLIRYAFVDGDHAHRATPDTIIGQLERLRTG